MTEENASDRSPYAAPSAAAGPLPSMPTDQRMPLLPPGKESSVSLSVWEAYASVIRGEEAIPRLLIGAVFILASGFIPILPQILYWGFLCYEAENRIRFPERRPLSFNFDHFTKYLGRGVWAFLVQMVGAFGGGLVVSMFLLPLFFLGFFGIAMLGAADETLGVVGGIVGFTLFFLLSLALGLLLNAIIALMYFRAGMTGSFAEGFRGQWLLGIVRRYGRRLMIDLLVWGLMATGLSLAGLLLFCVGLYVAQAWAILALVNYLTQFYRLTLAEGAEPFMMDRKVTLESLES